MKSVQTTPPGFEHAPPFLAPWHARLFALTLHLHEQGLFTWPHWTAALADQLAARTALTTDAPADDIGDNTDDTYYLAWLAALTACLESAEVTDRDQLRAMQDRWAAAIHATPHGQPVQLGKNRLNGPCLKRDG